MKIKTSARIQRMVDNRPIADIAQIADIATLANIIVTDRIGPEELAADGVYDGFKLARKLIKKREHCTNGIPLAINVYEATANSACGTDTFYFVGTIDEICVKLARLEKNWISTNEKD